MSNKEKQAQKEYGAMMNALLKEMMEATEPILRKTPSPVSGVNLIAYYAQRMVASVAVTQGLPVTECLQSTVNVIGNPPQQLLDQWEHTSTQVRDQRMARAKATASIIDMNGNPIK